MQKGVATVAQLSGFDEIIDARTPAEFAEDHIPGAINLPVLDNDERIVVGTMYKQQSAFDARRLGGALVAANISRHMLATLQDKPKNWRPLIYCWRGGMRSGAMTTVFRSVGWNACQLEGGYKTYRRAVVERLESLPGAYSYRVLCGPTGSAKTRCLNAIGELGEQTLDLEGLACHKGSVLGVLPGTPQPSQKWFETCLLRRLAAFDPARPVYVEAESRKVGNLQVPEALIKAIRASRCLEIEATLPARVAFLLGDYHYFPADPAWLKTRLAALHGLQSNETLARWNAYVEAGQWPELVTELLGEHYDPLYHRSQGANYAGFGAPERFTTDDLSPAGIVALARRIVSGEPLRPVSRPA